MNIRVGMGPNLLDELQEGVWRYPRIREIAGRPSIAQLKRRAECWLGSGILCGRRCDLNEKQMEHGG